ncbi:MAG: hypothetical protein IT374_11640 [Polyangiaceae bacterium]|nr:hypothetical protein [Polyangiaceae bacterium]
MPRCSLATSLVLLVAALSVVGCSVTPPARWAEGGAALALGRARWDRGGEPVDLLPDGKVLVGGDHLYTLDGAGRVTTPERDPVAMLYPTGHLVGPDEQALGFVGVASAALPGASTAWVLLAPNQQVVVYDEDGLGRSGGVWQGCVGPVLRTCTLITHLVRERDLARRPRFMVGVGIGVGIGR